MERRAEIFLWLAILAFLAGKFLLALIINVHWDEFYFLSLIHDYLRGTLTARMQTFHVHLLGWLPHVADDEIGQIVAGRFVMAAFGAATAPIIYGIARQFLTRPGALLGVLGYVSVTAVLEHGSSFRTDPLVTFVSVSAVYLTLRYRHARWALLCAGALMALATIVTIKSVFYLVPLAAVVILSSRDMVGRCREAILFAIAFTAVLAALYFGHAASLPAQLPQETTRYLHNAASRVILEEGFLPRWEELLFLIGRNPLYILMLGNGALIAWRHRRAENAMQRYWLLLALNLLLGVPLFYRNAFAYCYVFLLPFSALLVGLSAETHLSRLAKTGPRAARRLVAVFAVLQIAVLSASLSPLLEDEIAPQKDTLAAVHEIFPTPVTYIDGYGALATYPRFSFFMSSLGLTHYRKAATPLFPDLVARGQPPLLLADSVALFEALTPNIVTEEDWKLLPEDRRFLAENYIQHWGLVFVAGKRFEIDTPGSAVAFDIAIAGDYRVEGASEISIDGHNVVPRESVHLTAGVHRLTTDRIGEIVLRWAAAKPGPAREPAALAVFFGGE